MIEVARLLCEAGACPNSAHPSGVIALTMHLGRFRVWGLGLGALPESVEPVLKNPLP